MAGRGSPAALAAIACACGHPAAAVIGNRAPPTATLLDTPIEATATAEAARLARAHTRVAEGAPCLPMSAVESTTLVRAGDRALVCALGSADGHAVGPIACWSIDPRSGARTYQTPGALPGVSFAYHAPGRCPAGLCLPAAAERGQQNDDGDVDLAWSTDLRHVAVVVARHDVYLFDAVTRRFLRTIDIYDREGGRAGVSNAYVGLAFVGDTIFVGGSDAGPWASVWSFGLDGRALGELDAGETGIYQGALGPLDARHVGLATYAMESLIEVDATSGARRARARALPTPPCTNYEALDDLDALTPECRAFALHNLAPFVDAAPVALPDGDLLAVLADARWGELVILDGKTLAEKRSLGTIVCPRAR